MLYDNVQKIDQIPAKERGMDIVIVSTSNSSQADFWQKRLNETGKDLLPSGTLILVIEEDWRGGAGNGLGTLYAYQKARIQAKTQYGIDILQRQAEGAAVALYHTAGHGMRLYPLAASEYGNKSGVKLPAMIDKSALTVLEAVIKQTSIFASSRHGRLSVFWGDQLFIPSKSCDYEPRHHVDILAMVGEMPSKQEWEQRRLESYGVLALEKSGDAKLLEKSDFGTIKSLISSKKISVEGGVGISMGSFSLSLPILKALLEEFSAELDAKQGKLDTDPAFWMPTTLDFETYLSIMNKKNQPQEQTKKIYARMKRFKEEFCAGHPELAYFGVVDIGNRCYWWDYGTVDNFFQNNLKLISLGSEGEVMRKFFKISPPENLPEDLVCDQSSCLVDCNIKSGKIKNSVLIGVTADYLEVENSVIVNGVFKEIEAKDSLLYNVIEEQKKCCESRVIRADIILDNKHLKLYSQFGHDGKAEWKIRLPGNSYSWEEMHDKIAKKQLKEKNHKT